MKKLLTILFLFPVMLIAQTEQGRLIVDADFSTVISDNKVIYDGATLYEDDQTEIEGDFRVGYVLIDNLEAGLGIGIGNTSVTIETLSAETSESYLFLDVFVRYYFLPDNNLKPFIGAFVGMKDVNSKDASGYESDVDGIGYGGSLGFAYFLNNQFAVEVLYNYNVSDLTGTKDEKIEFESTFSTIGIGILYSFEL